MSVFDDLLAFVRVETSALAPDAHAVLLNLRACAAGDADAGAESSADEPVWGALGVLSRPRAPDDDGAAEAIVARGEATLPVLAMRDVRLARARGNVNEGTVTVAGYGGAFLSFDDEPGSKGSIASLYVPFGFDGDGVASKAHALMLSPKSGEEAVILSHADGMAVAMADGALVLRSKTGKARIILDGDNIVIDAVSVTIQGNVTIGGDGVGVSIKGEGATIKIGDYAAVPSMVSIGKDALAVPIAAGPANLGTSPYVRLQPPS